MIRVCLYLLFVGCLLSSVYADEQVTEFPLVETLQQTDITLFDPVKFSQQVLGYEGEFDGILPTPLYNIGDTKQFWIINEAGSTQIEAELRLIGQKAWIWVDVEGDVSDEHLAQVSYNFDEVIYPQGQILFGDFPNAISPIYILYAGQLDRGTSGYFTSRDFYPAEVMSTSNEYPIIVINLDLPRNLVNGLVAHEYQHFLSFYVKQHEVWLNEGFSSFFDHYLGYNNLMHYVTLFFSTTNTQLNIFGGLYANPIVNYAPGFLFVSYFYQRYGLEGIQTLYQQSGKDFDIFANTLAIVDPTTSFENFFADWLVANYLFNDEQWGYGDFFPARPYFRSQRLHNNSEYTLPQYSANYFNFIVSGDIQLHVDFPEIVPLIPTNPTSGEYMWYSNRANGSTTTLTQTFDLRDTPSATLTFDLWHDIEEFWNYSYMMASIDDGQTWEFIEAEGMTNDNPFNRGFHAGWTGSSDGWQQQSISLDPYVGEVVQIRFQYIIGNMLDQHGIALDNIAVPEIGYFSDLEADGGDWVADGWVRIDNRLPQKAWVQMILYDSDNTVIDVQRWLYPDEPEMILRADDDVKKATLIVSPFAYMTTIPTTYHLNVERLEAD